MSKMILIDADELRGMLQNVIREELSAAYRNKPESEDQFLSPAEACKMFSPAVTRQTLSNWVAANYLQKHMVGKKPFFKRSEVLAAAKTLQRYKKPSSISK